jgi:hypothetical protein
MAITNGYCTLNELKAALRITDNTDNTLLENAIEGASRRIDGYCGRYFYQQNATVKLFARDIQAVFLRDDLVSVTTLATDDAGDQTFSTVWTAGTDYSLEPYDANLLGIPYFRITAVGGKTFPIFTVPPLPGVSVTGVWGYPSIPDDVREACVLLAARGFARYNAALGVVGFGDMALQVRAVDPDVRDFLNRYLKMGIG